jgi:hypothetical protein
MKELEPEPLRTSGPSAVHPSGGAIPNPKPSVIDVEGLMIAARTFPGAIMFDPLREHPLLQQLAQSHAVYQAVYRQQGHQHFQQRFDKILAELGLWATEIAAESWPENANASPEILGADMLDSWKHSPGHWRVASTTHTFIGQAMARSSAGIWYACGLVADPPSRKQRTVGGARLRGAVGWYGVRRRGGMNWDASGQFRPRS